MPKRTHKQGSQMIEDCRKSGKPRKTWCEENGVPYSTYVYWLRVLSKEKENKTTTKASKETQWVTITPLKEEITPIPPLETLVTPSPTKIRLTKAGYEINIETGYDPTLLTSVLQVVNRVCC